MGIRWSSFSRLFSPAPSPESDLSTLPTRDHLIQAFTQDFQQIPLCLDHTRIAFIETTVATLRSLVLGELKHATGYRQLLLGHKGIGKTTLLKSIIRSAKKHLSQFQLLCIHISYDLIENVDCLPVELIRHGLKKDYSIPVPKEIVYVADLEEWLVKHNFFIFLVLDAFYLVYTNAFPTVGQAIVKEVSSIGSSHLGRIHCVLSGSNTVIKRLCYSRISSADAHSAGYVNFIAGVDLNDTKYSEIWIDPFLEAQQFRNLVRILCNSKPVPGDNHLARIYLKTGGNPRLIHQALMRVDESLFYTLTSYLPRGESDARTILVQLINLVSIHRSQILQSLSNPLHHVASFASQIDLNTLLLLPPVAAILSTNPGLLYDMVDDGLIRMQGSNVSLDHAAVWFELTHGSQFIVEELFAMVHPVGNKWGTTAKSFTMRLLAEGGACRLFQFPSQMHLTSRKLVLASISESSSPSSSSPPSDVNSDCVDDSPNDLSPVVYNTASMRVLGRSMWKESHDQPGLNSDKLGADAVFFEECSTDDNSNGLPVLLVHRIQIQLGRGSSNVEDQTQYVNQVIQRFATMEPKIVQLYSNNKSLQTNYDIRFQKHLLTTRQLAPENVKLLANSDINLFNSESLSQHIWPDEIKKLGAPYG